MKKVHVLSSYQRVLFSSAIKKERFISNSHGGALICRNFSSNSNKDTEKETEKISQHHDEKSFKLQTGEIGGGGSTNQPSSSQTMNLEEAKKLAMKQYEIQRQVLEDKLESVRIIFGGGNGKQPRNADEEWYAKRVSFWMKRYEDFVGLTEVKGAQARVVECERKFIEMQDFRREAQGKITDIQKKIKVFLNCE